MNTTSSFTLILLFIVSTVWLPFSYSQDSTGQGDNLPEGAKRRIQIGPALITQGIENPNIVYINAVESVLFSPDG